jgi:hypothetical protein
MRWRIVWDESDESMDFVQVAVLICFFWSNNESYRSMIDCPGEIHIQTKYLTSN